MAIAIFGGSFNPPANSHVGLAKQVLDEYKLIEKIIFVPVSTKYNKSNLIEDEHRFNMLKIICDKNENLDVSDVELKSKNQLYTIETLNYFKNMYSNKEIYFIMGTDNLKEFETWRLCEEILKSFKLIILKRNNDKIEDIINNSKLLSNYRNSIIVLENIEEINLSSTIVREKIKNAEDVKNLLDEDVLEYIKTNKLYV